MTLIEIAQGLGEQQARVAAGFLNSTPILNSLPFAPATNPLKNIYTRLDNVGIIQKRNVDGELKEVSASFKQISKDLGLYGAILTVPSDTAQLSGGAPAYFARQLPAVLQNSGIAYETDTLKNELLATSKAFGKDVSVGSGNDYIIAIEWIPSINTMLYDPMMFGRGMLFESTPVLNGAEHSIKTSDTGTILGYALALRSNFGIQIGDERKIASISGIDLSATLPTDLDSKIDDMIEEARLGNNGVIYMSSKLLSKLSKFKTDKLVVGVNDTNMNRRISYWNGFPIVTSHNFY